MSRPGRTGTAFEMAVREYVRTPLLVVLLVFLPAYFVGFVSAVVPDGRVPVRVDGGQVLVELGDAFAVLMAPMAVALVAGIAGLFLMHSARDADARLAVAGYRPPEVVLARLAHLAVVVGLATVAAVGVTVLTFRPDHLGWFVLAAALLALTYGLVGLLAGIVLDRLPGVYLLLFGPSLDAFLFQNPTIADPLDGAALLPAHYAMELATEAAFGSPAVGETLWLALAYAAGLAVVGAAALYRQLGVD